MGNTTLGGTDRLLDALCQATVLINVIPANDDVFPYQPPGYGRGFLDHIAVIHETSPTGTEEPLVDRRR